MTGMVRHIIIFLFLSLSVTTAYSADAIYINTKKITEYIKTISQRPASDKRNIPAEMVNRIESIDGFIQGNIILWDTLGREERKKRIRDFDRMLEELYRLRPAKPSPDNKQIKNELDGQISIILSDIMKKGGIHVLLEIDKGEDTPAGAVDATDDVISGITRYIENCGCIEGQGASPFDLTSYRTGLINRRC